MTAILEIEVLGTSPDNTLNSLPVPVIARYHEGRVMIGSRPSETPSLTIKDGTISRRHCMVSLIDGVWYLQDLGSDNATWILEGDKPVRIPAWENVIIDGEARILVGYVVLELRITEEK